jgi:hypothetical protein
MGLIRSLVFAVVSKKTAAAMEAESRRWVMTCPCGFETSIWEMGGIRYKAIGTPWKIARCAKCRRIITGFLTKRPEADPPPPDAPKADAT